jgi:hypothetical protein
MLIGSTAGHRPIRLLRSYRGRPAGSVVVVTPDYAERLVGCGLAVYATRGDMPGSGDVVEHAVATPAVEVRNAY